MLGGCGENRAPTSEPRPVLPTLVWPQMSLSILLCEMGAHLLLYRLVATNHTQAFLAKWVPVCS